MIISESSLVLQRVARSSAGRYTCHASNAEGEGSSSPFHLHVARKSRIFSDVFCFFFFFFFFKPNFFRLLRSKVSLLPVGGSSESGAHVESGRFSRTRNSFSTHSTPGKTKVGRERTNGTDLCGGRFDCPLVFRDTEELFKVFRSTKLSYFTPFSPLKVGKMCSPPSKH